MNPRHTHIHTPHAASVATYKWENVSNSQPSHRNKMSALCLVGDIFFFYPLLTEPGNPKHDLFFFLLILTKLFCCAAVCTASQQYPFDNRTRGNIKLRHKSMCRSTFPAVCKKCTLPTFFFLVPGLKLHQQN